MKLIQNEQAKNNELQDKNNELQDKNNDLKAKINDMPIAFTKCKSEQKHEFENIN